MYALTVCQDSAFIFKLKIELIVDIQVIGKSSKDINLHDFIY